MPDIAPYVCVGVHTGTHASNVPRVDTHPRTRMLFCTPASTHARTYRSKDARAGSKELANSRGWCIGWTKRPNDLRCEQSCYAGEAVKLGKKGE